MKKGLKILKYIIIGLIIILSLLLVKNISDLNILPSKYFILMIVILAIMNILSILLLLVKKTWTKIIGGFISAIIIIISVLGIFSTGDVNKFFNNAFSNNTLEINTYKVVAMKSSKYEKIEDIKNKTLGYLSNDDHKDAVLKSVDERVETEKKEYEDFYNIYTDFINGKIESMVIDTIYLDILGDEFGSVYDCIDTCSFNDDYKELYTFEIKTEKKLIIKK